MDEKYYMLLHKISKTKNMKFVKDNLHKISINHIYDVSHNSYLSEDIVLELSYKSPHLMNHPNIPFKRLEEVLLDDSYRANFLYKNYAVSNPAATEELLLKVIEKDSDNKNLMSCIAHNRELTLKVLLELRKVINFNETTEYNPINGLALEASNIKVIEYLIKEDLFPMSFSENPNLQENHISTIIDKYWDDDEVMLNLAIHKKSTSEHLDKLSRSKYEWARTKVALNKKTSLETLEFLSKDNSANVRKHVAKNPITSSEILKYLSEDRSSVVKNNAKKNLEKRS